MPKLNDLEVDQYLYDSVAIEPEAIQEEMVRVPSDIAYWGEQKANALKAFKIAKLTKERGEATLNMTHREALALGATKAPTVDAVRASVVSDSRYEELALAEIEAEATYAALQTRFTAICAKKDMVQSLGAQLRAEMEKDPMTRDRVRTQRLDATGLEMGEDAQDF